MSEEETRDPMLDEFKFCESCEPHVLTLVQHVRDQENAILVAKQAIETLSALNGRLTDKYHKLRAEFDLFMSKVEEGKRKGEAWNLKKKFDAMDKQIQRFENRSRLLV